DKPGLPGQGPPKPPGPSTQPARSSMDAGGAIGIRSGKLRDAYNFANQALKEQMQRMLDAGLDRRAVADWYVKQGNLLKEAYRKKTPIPLDEYRRWQKGVWDKPTLDMLLSGDKEKNIPGKEL